MTERDINKPDMLYAISIGITIQYFLQLSGWSAMFLLIALNGIAFFMRRYSTNGNVTFERRDIDG